MLRDVITIDESRCDGCGQCVTACAEGALAIVEGKARLVSEVYCDGLGACLGHCPRGAITVTKREAPAFDAAAVQAHLAKPTIDLHACPGSQPRSTGTQHLANWPVQLRLVNPAAPFLKDAELLLTADCVPVALPTYHRDWVPGRVVLLACPKLDDLAAHTAKLAQILQVAKPRKLTVLRMEVPCCGGLAWAAKQAVDQAGTRVPVEVVTIAINGVRTAGS